jgi:ATP-dependent protease Clp ATPase subunit
MTKRIVYCSFCGASQEDVKLIIAGMPSSYAYICGDCAIECSKIVEANTRARELAAAAFETIGVSQ